MVLAILRFRGAPAGGARPPATPGLAELVGAPPGLVEAEVLTDGKALDAWYLATRWVDLAAFDRWYGAGGRRRGNAGPGRLEPDHSFRLILFLDRSAHPRGSLGAETLAIHRPDLVGRFLAASGSLHFLALSRAGAILACNPAVLSTLGLPAEGVVGRKLSGFLTEPDARRLGEWLDGGPAPAGGSLRLALLDRSGTPLVLACETDLRPDGLVLLGEPLREEESRLRARLDELGARVGLLDRENGRKAKAFRRLHAKLRSALEEMKEARALWEATAMFESTLRDLERSIARLERTDRSRPPVAPAPRSRADVKLD
jgi:PAS domain-containing protein